MPKGFRMPPASKGLKQPGNQKTIQGPVYPEAQGKGSTIWTSDKGTSTKRGPVSR